MVYQVRTAVYWGRKMWWRGHEKNKACLFLTTKSARKTFNFVNIHWIGWFTKWGRPFIGVVKCDDVINGRRVTLACFNFVVAPSLLNGRRRPWCECMYCLPIRLKTRVWKGIVVERSGSAVWGPSFQTLRTWLSKSARGGSGVPNDCFL